ncbi:MAG: hypothetical protein D6800_13310, partial [Candidatus Zixiibacteriota bacterium]
MKRLIIHTILLLLLGTTALRAQFDRPPDNSFLFNTFTSVLVKDSFAIVGERNGLAVLTYDSLQDIYRPVSSLYLTSAPTEYKRYGDTVIYRTSADLLEVLDMTQLPELRT